MSAGNPPPSRRTDRPASDTRRRRATGPAASPARRCPTRHAHDRQMSPPSRKTPLPMVVHPSGEVKASKALSSCPPNAPIRPIVAITQLPDLGLFAALSSWRAVSVHLRSLSADRAQRGAHAVLKRVPEEL